MDGSSLGAAREQEGRLQRPWVRGKENSGARLGLHQWLSNFRECQNQLEAWLKRKLLGPTPRVSELEGL